MADERPPEVLGALPRTRPQRRSTKRPVRHGQTGAGSGSGSGAGKPPVAEGRTGKTKPARARATAVKPSDARPGLAKGATASPKTSSGSGASKRKPKPLRQPPQPRGIPAQPRAPVPPDRPEVLGTAVQAAAELAEIGLALTARALRRAASRLPRP